MQIHDGVAERNARCLPRLIRELADLQSTIAVGDWVLCNSDVHGQTWAEHRFEPLSSIVRRDADGTRHTVVSNVDSAFLVMGLDLDFNLQRLERYLARWPRRFNSI